MIFRFPHDRRRFDQSPSRSCQSCGPSFQTSLSCVLFAVVLFASPVLLAQGARTQIIVERRTGKTFQAMNPQHVFGAGDRIRFRFRSASPGYLYVTDQSSSGKYVVLFPGSGNAGEKEASEIKADKDYLVPATANTWFRVDNPPGYETIFFVISPTPLKAQAQPGQSPDTTVSPTTGSTDSPLNTPPNPGSPAPSADMLPRCNDAIFQARGDCTDVLAGPRKVPAGEQVPGNDLPVANSREVTIINKPKSSVIAPSDPDQAPFIYEFRLAHH